MARLKVQIYLSKDKRLDQWCYRVVRGSRIILTPGETYTRRQGVRRAVTSLAELAMSGRDSLTVTPLAEACFDELEAEAARWKTRDRRIVLDQP